YQRSGGDPLPARGRITGYRIGRHQSAGVASILQPIRGAMSALGQEQSSLRHSAMSASPLKADIASAPRNVRFLPKADKRTATKKHNYSITSSAIASSLSGISRPSALAVLRLMMSSNLVGCITGKSAGLAPLRIRPT